MLQIRENNAINSTTSYIDPPVLTSRWISHWRIVTVFSVVVFDLSNFQIFNSHVFFTNHSN